MTLHSLHSATDRPDMLDSRGRRVAQETWCLHKILYCVSWMVKHRKRLLNRDGQVDFSTLSVCICFLIETKGTSAHIQMTSVVSLIISSAKVHSCIHYTYWSGPGLEFVKSPQSCGLLYFGGLGCSTFLTESIIKTEKHTLRPPVHKRVKMLL